MTSPGPAALGRGVVVAGAPVPPAWSGAPVVRVDEAALAAPSDVVGRLHEAWARRRPVVVDLAVDPARFRAPRSWSVEPWTLDAGFEAWEDRLHFLVWANTYDARDGSPVWWWGRKAERLGASPSAGGDGDVVLPDGRAAWVDGGPRGPLDVALPVVHRESVELGRLAVVPPSVAPAATLAPDQVAAVAAGAGLAVRVIAPAGSGKTRVLTERLRHLLVDRAFEPEAVLAVAYNRRAREEMEARTAELSPRVSTLNALGLRLLGSPRVLDERDVRRLVVDLVPAQRRRANTDPLAPYLEGLSAIRLALRDPAEVEASRDDVPGLAAAFPEYRAALRGMGAVDFDEQIYGAVERLLADGEFRARAQAGCRHLLVDEFQDLTPAHVLLLRLLATPGLDVFGVGDDDQTIYSHVGADPRFLVDYDRFFPAAEHHPLEVNYRCPVAVVERARTLLAYNRVRVAKEIRPGPDADPSPDALAVRRHRPEEGATGVVAVVQDWLADGVEPASVAVLTRVNSLLLAPHVALAEAGVPVASALTPEVLERTGIRAALAYLRIGADPHHIAKRDVLEVLRRPSRGLPNWFEKWLKGTNSVDSIRAIADRLDDPKVGAKVEALADDLELASGATTRLALESIRDRIGLGSAMEQLDGSKGSQNASQLDDLEALLQVADLHPDPATFEGWLRRVFHRESDEGGVTLSTVHRVKGMEWDRVAVYGVNGGLLPHRLAEDVEEERRVLHVAITRGRHGVTVLADATRPSPFLDELAGAARQPAVRQVAVAQPRPEKAGPTAEEEPLRAWRLARSRADGVPAYVVLTDETLRALVEARPTSTAGLRRIKGIGPAKVEKYGEEILEVLGTLR